MDQTEDSKLNLLPEHPHHPRQPIMRYCQQTTIPAFVCDNNPKVCTILPNATDTKTGNGVFNSIHFNCRFKLVHENYTSVIVLQRVPGRGTRNVVDRLVKDYSGLVANEHFLKKSWAFVLAKRCQHFVISRRVDYLLAFLLMDGRISLYQVYSR